MEGVTTTRADSLASELGKMEISPQAAAPPSQPEAGKFVPIRRPQRGGSAGTHTIRLPVNHFPLCFDDRMVIYHYNINIVRPPHNLPKGPEAAAPPDLTESELSVVKSELFRAYASQFRATTVAYDREKNLFSLVELPVGDFKVVVCGSEYMVTVRLQKPGWDKDVDDGMFFI